jgi:DNA-binding response OmpR family regulator
LIVEYDKDMLDLLGDEISEVGHQVAKVSRYSSAILEASEGDFDVIIAEVGTPGMVEPEILSCLRKLQPNAFIAAMIGFGSE